MFESRWFAMAVVCLALAVLFSGCPTDGSSSSSNNNNGNDVISGVPDTYTLSEIWKLILARDPLVYSSLWSSTCNRYSARFEREQNPEIYQLGFGVSNMSAGSASEMGWDLGNLFNIGGRANYPFRNEDRLSLGRNAEGDVTWVIRNSGVSVMHSRGVIRFDYYESEIRRVMFYVEDFRFGGHHRPHFVQGLNNNIWLYRRRH